MAREEITLSQQEEEYYAKRRAQREAREAAISQRRQKELIAAMRDYSSADILTTNELREQLGRNFLKTIEDTGKSLKEINGAFVLPSDQETVFPVWGLQGNQMEAFQGKR